MVKNEQNALETLKQWLGKLSIPFENVSPTKINIKGSFHFALESLNSNSLFKEAMNHSSLEHSGSLSLGSDKTKNTCYVSLKQGYARKKVAIASGHTSNGYGEQLPVFNSVTNNYSVNEIEQYGCFDLMNDITDALIKYRTAYKSKISISLNKDEYDKFKSEMLEEMPNADLECIMHSVFIFSLKTL